MSFTTYAPFAKSLSIAILLLAPTIVSAAGNAPQPSICTRGCWGARAATSTAAQMSTLNRAIVHHTAGNEYNSGGYEDSKADVRAIQSYHMNTNGWSDIGYHFLVDKYGYTFEGRAGSMSSQPRGAHDGTNTNSFGFNVMGYFHPNVNNVPTAAMMDALYDVIAWRMPSAWRPYGSPGVYGELGIGVGYVDGHRRVKGTSCPGDNVFNPYMGSNMSAGAIRSEITNRINGTPAASAFGGVDACSWDVGRIDVFTRGASNELRHQYFSGGTWSGWYTNGTGSISSDPSVVSWDVGRLDVFARSTAGTLLHKYFVSGAWSGWQDLGGAFVGAPDACSYEPGRLDVFVRGTDNAIWQKYYSAGNWSAWVSHGGTLNSDPSASASSGRIDVYARGGLNNIYHKYWNSGGSWSPWVNEGGTSASGPDACSWGPGRHDLFVRGGGDSVYHKYYDGSNWSSYVSLSGITRGDPGCSTWGTGRLDVFARGGGDDIYHKFFSGGVWSGSWQNMGH